MRILPIAWALLPFLMSGGTVFGQTAATPAGTTAAPTVLKTFPEAPTGETLVLRARGEGVQIYSCMFESNFAWKLKAPDATLFDDAHQAIGKHFAGPKWKLKDGSEIQGKAVQSMARPGTIPWLVIAATSTGGAGRLAKVDTVYRTDTSGGAAPEGGCDAQHPNAEVRVPYTATYSFFSAK